MTEHKILLRLNKFLKKVCSIEEYRSSDLLEKFLMDKKGFEEVSKKVLEGNRRVE